MKKKLGPWYKKNYFFIRNYDDATEDETKNHAIMICHDYIKIRIFAFQGIHSEKKSWKIIYSHPNKTSDEMIQIANNYLKDHGYECRDI